MKEILVDANLVVRKHLLDLSKKYTHLGDLQLEKGQVDEATDDYMEAEKIIKWMEPNERRESDSRKT